MEQIFATLAISGASLVSKAAFSSLQSYAVKQISSYVQETTQDKSKLHVKLVRLQDVLQRKLAVVSPAIDTCEIVAARGNTSLEAVLPLAAGLSEELSKLGDIAETGKSAAGQQQVTASVLEHVERVIATIDDLVPFLQLALQSCGARVSSSLPTSISPGRLLQASSAVSLAASRFAAHSQFGPVQPPGPVQVGPLFPARVYSLFQSSARAKNVSDVTWKEDMVKASVCVQRVPPDLSMLTEEEKSSAAAASLRSRICYELVIVENLNDGRYHEELDGKTIKPGTVIPGRRTVIPVTDLQRLYYSHSGKLLNIDAKAPVMVVKVVKGNAQAHTAHDAEGTPLRTNEKVEWLAFELWQEDDDDKGQDTGGDSDEDAGDVGTDEDLPEDPSEAPVSVPEGGQRIGSHERIPLTPMSRGFLSTLEYILRLTAVEVSEQRSHLDVPDEKLNLYLANEVGSRRGRADIGGMGGRLSSGSSLRTQASHTNTGSMDSPLARKAGGVRFLDRLIGSKDTQSSEKAE